MKFQIVRRTLAAALLSIGMTGYAAAGNTNAYYLFDGDSSNAWVISNGVVVNTFNTFSLGYPAAIRDSIWLGQRDDAFAREYSLGGTATGNVSVGGGAFSQLLDGAAGSNGKNYGVECCGFSNSVTVANGDWSNQSVAFNLNDNGAGIAYNTSDNTIYVSYFSTRIDRFSVTGENLGSIDFGQFLVGLAYDDTTDSIWGWNRRTEHLVQFNAAGTVLQDFAVAGIAGNPFGGEMAIRDLPTEVPEPATYSMLVLGAFLLAAGRRKWSK